MRLYRLLLSIAAPILVLVLFARVLRGREAWSDFTERLGRLPALGAAPLLWIHGASNGEVTAARPFIEALSKRLPDHRILITTNTVTARKMVRGWQNRQIASCLAPLDLRWLYRRSMRALPLRAFILIEADFWPNRLIAAKSCGASVILIGGRMSEKSFRGWQKRSALAKVMMSQFDQVVPQDSTSARRLEELGAPSPEPVLDLKSLYHAQTPVPENAARAETWLAASTHEGEDDILLEAHQIARRSVPALRMILAPRHPKRARQIATLARARGLDAALRSEGAEHGVPCDVYIADTLGEMPLWYGASFATFVAGSLVPKGGHTPFEPAAYDSALIHGPHLENFATAYADLSRENGAIAARSAEEIAAALVNLHDTSTAEMYKKAAKQTLLPTKQLDQTLDRVVALVMQAEGC